MLYQDFPSLSVSLFLDPLLLLFFFFFFNDTAPTEIYPLSLHDALPIWAMPRPPPILPCGPYCAGMPPPPSAWSSRPTSTRTPSTASSSRPRRSVLACSSARPPRRRLPLRPRPPAPTPVPPPACSKAPRAWPPNHVATSVMRAIHSACRPRCWNVSAPPISRTGTLHERDAPDPKPVACTGLPADGRRRAG